MIAVSHISEKRAVTRQLTLRFNEIAPLKLGAYYVATIPYGTIG
jgi:hypothetical protein